MISPGGRLRSAVPVVHPTYKHLEDRVRLAGLTLGQWSQLLICGLAAYALATLLPLPSSWSVSVAVTACGLPAASAITFMSADSDVCRWLRAAVRWRRAPRRYLGADAAAGSPVSQVMAPESGAFESEALWDV
jgi:hypothetical protein